MAVGHMGALATTLATTLAMTLATTLATTYSFFLLRSNFQKILGLCTIGKKNSAIGEILIFFNSEALPHASHAAQQIRVKTSGATPVGAALALWVEKNSVLVILRNAIRKTGLYAIYVLKMLTTLPISSVGL